MAVVVEQKDVLVGSPGDRRQNRKISERLRRIGVPKVEELIDVVCVLAYTLPNANRPLVLRGTSSLRVSKSSCEDTAYGSRPFVCDHSSLLSLGLPHEDRRDPPARANRVQQARGIYGTYWNWRLTL